MGSTEIMTAPPRSFDGGCHCGAVAFTFRTARPPERWEGRACQCSFCRSHGARSTSDPDGAVAFRIADAALLQRYRFGSKRTDFLICRRCGVYVAAVITTPRGALATLNVNTLDAGRRASFDAMPVSYEGESVEERQARREKKWTPVAGPV